MAKQGEKQREEGVLGAFLAGFNAVADALLLALVLILSLIAVIAIALAAPLTLVVSALAGLLMQHRRRPAEAA